MEMAHAVVGRAGGVHVTGRRKGVGFSEVATAGSKGPVQSELA